MKFTTKPEVPHSHCAVVFFSVLYVSAGSASCTTWQHCMINPEIHLIIPAILTTTLKMPTIFHMP